MLEPKRHPVRPPPAQPAVDDSRWVAAAAVPGRQLEPPPGGRGEEDAVEPHPAVGAASPDVDEAGVPQPGGRGGPCGGAGGGAPEGGGGGGGGPGGGGGGGPRGGGGGGGPPPRAPTGGKVGALRCGRP